jgi:hypothetical protein
MNPVDYDKLKSQLENNEQADFDFQKRRHEQWTENYQFYRDKVITNRLTQRQSINVPFIKGIVKTVLANTDEFPKIEFEELGNNKDQEIILNELWSDFVIKDRLEVKDIIDKKQNLLYGKTWHKFNIVGGKIVTEIKDVFDILVDRYGDPADIETLDHISEHGIYRTIGQLEQNPAYDKAAINRLKLFYGTKDGLIKAEELTKIIAAKNERLESLGVPSMDSPLLGQTWVELKVHYQKIWDKDDKEFHIHVIVKADHEILSAKPLKDILGIDFYPFVTWSDDPERLDHYPDGVADTARTANKLLNANVSALTENRILRNFGMNFYDTGMDGFVPQTYEPQPFGWYGVPVPEGKKLDDVFKRVDIPDLSESIDEMEYVKSLVETAVAANSTVQGNTEQKKVTLGEVELAMSAAKERLTSIAKFYMLAATEKADKWAKIMNANPDKIDSVKLYKKSHKGNYFSKTVSGKDWKSDAGYLCRAVSSAERENQSMQTIQKLNAVKAQFPDNPAMNKIYGNKLLEFGDLTPDEIKEVMDFEAQKMSHGMVTGMPPDAMGGSPPPAMAPPAPIDPMQLNQPVNV